MSVTSDVSASSPRLAGQVAIITGASRGIGRAMAQVLAQEGVSLALVARTRDDLMKTSETISGLKAPPLLCTADVTDRAEVDRLVEEVVDAFGRIDLLVNNAGRGHAIGPLWEIDPDDWWRDVEVNLRGVFLCSRAVLSLMLRQGAGRIVNVSSMAAAGPFPYAEAYASSKAAVLRLTDSLSAALATSGVKVFAVSPGTVHTQMTDHILHSEQGRKYLPLLSRLPEEAWQAPEAVGHLVVRLACGDGDPLSGRFIHITDNLDDLVRDAAHISTEDRYVLRLRR